MKEMSKVFEYGTCKFNIKVELNTRTEKRPNGNTWHDVTVNDMGLSNFYFKNTVEDIDLPNYLQVCEKKCIEWVDGFSTESKTEKYLTSLGFK